MPPAEHPPVVAFVGRKNSGKTTLVVAVAAKLKRRGLRVVTVKHGHHAFEFDQPGRDSWRHFHEGGAEATIMMGGDRLAMVMRFESEPDPAQVIARFYGGAGYDLVLVEGFKHGPFPRVEIFRRAVHDTPLVASVEPGAESLFLAVVTDDPEITVPCLVIPLDPVGPEGAHVAAVADLVQRHCLAGDASEG